MSDELNEMRVRIAGLQVECVDCHGAGYWLAGNTKLACTKCRSTGRVHRFGDALRAKCHSCRGYARKGCGGCFGRGWTVPGGFGWLLLKELRKAGWVYRITPSSVRVWSRGVPVLLPASDDPELDLYRTVCAVLEVAPADYRRARGISPLPEGAEMPEETIRRLRDGTARRGDE